MEMLSLQNFCPALSKEEIVKIARECGFSKRVEKKYLPINTCYSTAWSP
jgi:hypothetical protein